MATLPTNVSESTRKLNPHLYGTECKPTCATQAPAEDFGHLGCTCASSRNSEGNFGALLGGPVKKRLRQEEVKERPWEKEWKQLLESQPDWTHVKAQSLRVRLANGAWYRPDVSAVRVLGLRKVCCFEIKGGKKMKGVAKGILALKVAASLYPEFEWFLIWKENGQFVQQEIKP